MNYLAYFGVRIVTTESSKYLKFYIKNDVYKLRYPCAYSCDTQRKPFKTPNAVVI